MLPSMVRRRRPLQTWRWMLTNNGNLNVGGIRVVHNRQPARSAYGAQRRPDNSGSAVTGNYFTAGQTHVVSGKFIAGATGSIEINIDGVNIIPTTTINTTTSHPSGAAGGFSMAVAGTAHTRVYHYGDWLFDDAAYPDPTATVIARQFKSGTPTYDQWDLVGGGTKYGNISETPPSATLAIATASSTAALAQTAFINSFSTTETGKGTGTIGGSDTILGVRVEAYARASSGNLGHTRLRVGGVDTDAQVANMTVGVLLRWGAVQTGVSLSDLNAGEAGFVKPVTGTARIYTVEDMWVLAAYVPAGITHYTIAAEAGSYALTGTAAGLRATRKIAAAAGTYALTGTAAGLKAGRKFAAAAGSYALTGSIAGLKRGRKVAAPAGSYSLTGASAGLLTTRRLGSGAGSYLLTGTPAGLIYSVADPVLTVETGAYALTGTAAGPAGSTADICRGGQLCADRHCGRACSCRTASGSCGCGRLLSHRRSARRLHLRASCSADRGYPPEAAVAAAALNGPRRPRSAASASSASIWLAPKPSFSTARASRRRSPPG